MAGSRSGPVIVLCLLVALLVGLWCLLSPDPDDGPGRTAPPVAWDMDVVEEPGQRAGRVIPSLGLAPDPMVADVTWLPSPQADILLPESDTVVEETGGALQIPAEPADLTLLVEKAMRDVLGALCRRADECCPGEGLCDLEAMEQMPMDEVAEEMVRQGGEDPHLDEQALDECLVALRTFPCAADFDGTARAVCHEGDGGERACDEVPGKPTVPTACRRLVRGDAGPGEPCEEDQACDGDAVCVKVRGAEGQGTCRALAARGDPCTWSAGCQGDMLCVRGTCSPPRGAGQVCDGAQPWCSQGRCRVGTCAFGLTCRDGLCAPQGREGTGCRLEEDCARGMVCDSEAGCRWPGEGEEEWVGHPRPDPDAESPICKIFRGINERRRSEEGPGS
ncbi:MAG: Dickkopf N-terminal cysteine-rich domain-containing protein [Pseudomonadota bacterium]